MIDQQLLELFSRILRELLGDDSINVGMRTTRGDVPGWDSFNYINFIVAVEAELGIKFRIADVESFSNVGDIVEGARALVANRQE